MICAGALAGGFVASAKADASEAQPKDETTVNWTPDTMDLTSDDPVVQAVVGLLPAHAHLKEARHVIDRSREDAAD